MNTWIVLLRGVNVGGSGKLPMEALRKALLARDFTDVRTYIQSGNIVLCSSLESPHEVSSAIMDIIETGFGFRPPAIALRLAEMTKALSANPYPDDAAKAVHLFFMAQTPPSPDLEALRKLASTEEFSLAGPVFYLRTPDGIGRSKLAAAVERRLGEPATARNLNTVAKLIEMAAEADDG